MEFEVDPAYIFIDEKIMSSVLIYLRTDEQEDKEKSFI